MKNCKRKKEYLNCKVRCINDAGMIHTEGRIYSVVDGLLSDDDGCTFPIEPENRFYNIDEINNDLISKFELYIEPYD